MTGFGVELHDLIVRFRSTAALDGVTATILPDTICGLLGCNGSGKTTLLSTIAAFRRPSGGSARRRRGALGEPAGAGRHRPCARP